MESARFLADVVFGLSQAHKSIPCKWLYDERGSSLFERICELDAYYPTRTEIAITQAHAARIANLIGPDARLVELGSGSSLKTRILLDHLPDLHAYVPVDISRAHLEATARRLRHEYPHVSVLPLAADYLARLELPDESEGAASTVVYFPGSTIGNFEPNDAVAFMSRAKETCSPRGGLLIGTDLAKSPGIIEAAYNDEEGVTAAFNLNLLVRMERELGAKLDTRGFRHRAIYDRDHGRIVMQLVSIGRQRIALADRVIAFEDGEAMTTEHSYKYELDAFAQLAKSAGLSLRESFLDDRGWFALNWLVPD